MFYRMVAGLGITGGEFDKDGKVRKSSKNNN